MDQRGALDNLDPFPEARRCDLALIGAIPFAEFEVAVSMATQKWKEQGHIPEMSFFGPNKSGDGGADSLGGYY